MLNRFLIIVLAIVLNSCETTEFLKFHDFKFGWESSEIVEFDLSESFLKENMAKGFSIDFNSKASISNKITIPSSYLKGYLKVAN